jgi:hypothetical protein
MTGLSYALKAKNSNGGTFLLVNKDYDNTISFTLLGNYEGKDIQVDFDELSISEAKNLVNYIMMITEGEPNV